MKTSVQFFFEEYAAALLTYSAENIAAFYQVPMTVYSDQNIQQVTEMKEVVDFWEAGIKPYKSSGIEKTIPTVLSEEQLSETIHVAKVLWENYDAHEKQVAKETNFYIVSATENGFKISGLVIMAQ